MINYDICFIDHWTNLLYEINRFGETEIYLPETVKNLLVIDCGHLIFTPLVFLHERIFQNL